MPVVQGVRDFFDRRIICLGLIIILRWVSVFDDRPTRIPKEERTKKKMTVCSDSHGRNEIVMSGESNLYQRWNKGNRVNYNNEEEKKKNLVV